MTRTRAPKTNLLLLLAGFCSVLTACSKAPPPRTVSEFLDNSILLEATMVRCAQDRSKTKYEAECVNAREAANRLASAEEEARRIELEKQSERKRRALRRTQEAKAEARRRAAEARRRREEAEYLGIYEELPPDAPAVTAGTNTPLGEQNTPAADTEQAEPGVVMEPPETVIDPLAEQQAAEPSDIDSIREELKRRQEPTGP